MNLGGLGGTTYIWSITGGKSRQSLWHIKSAQQMLFKSDAKNTKGEISSSPNTVFLLTQDEMRRQEKQQLMMEWQVRATGD